MLNAIKIIIVFFLMWENSFEKKSRQLCFGSATKRCMRHAVWWEKAQVSNSLCYYCGLNVEPRKQTNRRSFWILNDTYLCSKLQGCWISIGLFILLLFSFIYSFIFLLSFFFRYLQFEISLGIILGESLEPHMTWVIPPENRAHSK